MIKDAKIDGKYRYWLYRKWDKNKPLCLFIMLNPSTADDKKDDRTIKKCIFFAKKFGFGGFYVVNLFSFKTPHKKEIRTDNNPIGEKNDAIILDIAEKTNKIIVAWGNDGRYMGRSKKVLNLLEENSFSVYCLKLTKHKEPCHPLYLPKNLELIPFPS